MLLCDPAWFEPRLEVEPRAHGARLSIHAEALTEPEDRFDARAASTQQVLSILCLWDDMSLGPTLRTHVTAPGCSTMEITPGPGRFD